MIHRDLKPQNIIYDDIKDEVTIIDFGSSKIKTIIDKETTMPMFSENYSAPEVVKGIILQKNAIIIHLELFFFEILLCENASDSKHMIEIIEHRVHKEEVQKTLCSMLQEDPKDRPENISDIMLVFQT